MDDDDEVGEENMMIVWMLLMTMGMMRKNMMIVWMLLPPGDVILGKQHWQCCLDERAGLALLKSPEIIETIEIT